MRRVLGELLCRLGLHHWDFLDEVYEDERGQKIVTFARCDRRCRHYPNWLVVGVERIES